MGNFEKEQNMDIIQVFLTSQEVFELVPSKQQLVEFIEGINTYPLSVLLSKLSYYGVGTHVFDKFFVECLKDLYPNYNYAMKAEKKLSTERILYTPQSIEILWKWILLYSRNHDCEKEIDQIECLYQCFHLMLGINGQLNINFSDDLIVDELNRNLYFNSSVDNISQIARSYFMFLDDNVQLSLSDCKEYVEIDKIYKQYYNYSIQEYFAVMLSLHFKFNSADKSLNGIWLLDYKEYYKSTSMNEIAVKIIEDLCVEEKIDMWLKESIDRYWDVEYFFNRPLIRTKQDKIFPVSRFRMHDQLHNALFFKIRESFCEKGSDFNTYMGRAFEYYLTWVVKETKKLSISSKYEIIEEFYFKKKQYRSPDLMIKLGNNILVFEAKLRRIAYKGLNGVENSFLKESQEKIVYKTIEQAIKSIEKIVEFNGNDKITQELQYYFITITPDIVPRLGEFQSKLSEILSQSKLKINYVGLAEIEEYEVLIEYMFRKNSKSIFRFLDRISKKCSYTSIKNEMLEASMRPKNPKVLKDYTTMVLKKIEGDLKPF